jgi:hypothetical protein
MQQQVEEHSLGSKLFAKNVWVLVLHVLNYFN